MSKQPGFAPGGTFTPQTLSRTAQGGNSSSASRRSHINVLLGDEFIAPLRAASDTLLQLESLLATLEDGMEKAGPASARLKDLAALGRYVAGDIGKHVDSVWEACQMEHAPGILAMLEGAQ